MENGKEEIIQRLTERIPNIEEKWGKKTIEQKKIKKEEYSERG